MVEGTVVGISPGKSCPLPLTIYDLLLIIVFLRGESKTAFIRVNLRLMKMIIHSTQYAVRTTNKERRLMEIFLEFSGRQTDWFV